MISEKGKMGANDKVKILVTFEDGALDKGVTSQGMASVQVEIDINHFQIWIKPQGYGEATAENGHGSTLMLEFYEGNLVLRAWNNINDEVPLQLTWKGLLNQDGLGHRRQIGVKNQ